MEHSNAQPNVVTACRHYIRRCSADVVAALPTASDWRYGESLRFSFAQKRAQTPATGTLVLIAKAKSKYGCKQNWNASWTN